MQMFIKLLNEDAIVPTRGTPESAGYDLYACIPKGPEENNSSRQIIIGPGEVEKIHTGISVEFPSGYSAEIYARSGLALKRGLRPANCVGLIDSDYRGEIIVALRNDSYSAQTIEHGERVAQIVFRKYEPAEFETVSELSETGRGSGGFGSTGK